MTVSRGVRLSVVLALTMLVATGCGTKQRLGDGSWYGKVVSVSVGQGTLTFAPACRSTPSGGWVAVPVHDRVPSAAKVAAHPDLGIYFRPGGDAVAGHEQSADLALIASVARRGRLSDFPPGWYVTIKNGLVTTLQEDSGLGATGRGEIQRAGCLWTRDTSAFVRRRRSSPHDAITLATFAGGWGGHDRGLSITRRGHGVEQINSGCCCPCFKLVFQLTQPGGTPQLASATATVTAVHAPPGGYATRPPLPHVGERGLIQLRNGQIIDTLTGENYCGPHAKGFAPCGA